MVTRIIMLLLTCFCLSSCHHFQIDVLPKDNFSPNQDVLYQNGHNGEDSQANLKLLEIR